MTGKKKDELEEKKAEVVDFDVMLQAINEPERKRPRPSNSRPHRREDNDVLERYMAQGKHEINRKKAEKKEKMKQRKQNKE